MDGKLHDTQCSNCGADHDVRVDDHSYTCGACGQPYVEQDPAHTEEAVRGVVRDNLLAEDFVIKDETLVISNGDNIPLNRISSVICANNTLLVMVGSFLGFNYGFCDVEQAERVHRLLTETLSSSWTQEAAQNLPPDVAPRQSYKHPWGRFWGRAPQIDGSASNISDSPGVPGGEAEAYFYRGCAYFDQHLYEEAAQQFQQVHRHEPNYAEAQVGIGYWHYLNNRYAEAVELYTEAIRLQPDYALAYNNLGTAYLEQQLYDEAIGYLKQAINLDPLNASPFNNLGNVYRLQRRYPEAVEQFKRAIELNPNLAAARFNLGVTYVATKDKGAAREQYLILKKLNPEMADVLLKQIKEKLFVP